MKKTNNRNTKKNNFKKVSFSKFSLTMFVLVFAAIGAAVLTYSYALSPVSASDQLGAQSGIYGTTYTKSCSPSGSCTTTPSSLIVYVYPPGGGDPYLNFISATNGSFNQVLSPGRYVLKGSPYCPFQQCLIPRGNVSITLISHVYERLKLVYDPAVGLTGGPQ